MFITYSRVVRFRGLPALAAAGAIVIVGSIAATVLAIVGVVGFGTRLLRTFGLVETEPPLVSQVDDAIEGVTVNRSPAGVLDR